MSTTREVVSGRVDARRNRERLVTCARELFAAGGVDVSLREISRHAGVGVGTLYRHFPAREDLVDAVLEDAFEEMIAIAEAALAEADPWRGFTRFIEEALILHAHNRCLKDVVETQMHGREHAASMRRRMRPLVERIVARAQEAGALRADFTTEDIPLLFWGSDRVIELSSAVAPELWRRHLGFFLDGLRSSAAMPLEQGPLSAAELRRIGRATRKQ